MLRVVLAVQECDATKVKWMVGGPVHKTNFHFPLSINTPKLLY